MTDYTEDAWRSVQTAGSAVGSSSGGAASSVTVTNFPASQAVSVAALPLPAGAATDGTDITTPTAMPAGGAGIRGWLSAIWTKLNGTLAVTGTFFQATQPVSGTVTVTQSTAANLVNTATQGPAGATANAWPIKNTDGTNTATVKAASTAAAAADSGLVVALHPTSPLPAGANVIGALTANQSVNHAQVNGGTVVASVTGVQDVMPRKRINSTGLSPIYTAFHITSNTTTSVTAATGYIQSALVCVTGAGSAWTIKIQNHEATPKVIYSATAALGTTQPVNLAEPALMTSGIDIVTAGTTAGTVDVFITYWQ